MTDRRTWSNSAGDDEGFALGLDGENKASDRSNDKGMLGVVVKAHASPVMRNIANKSLQDSNPDHKLGVSLLTADAKANLLDLQQATAIYESLAKDTDLEQLPTTVLVYISHIIVTTKNSNLEVVDLSLIHI